MVNNLLAMVFGLIFGLGLIVAQMVNPGKVLAFLDVAGVWDPSLALVMAGALVTLGVLQRAVHAPAAADDQDQDQASCGSPKVRIDLRLIAGAAIFGIGWGLSGVCPGPAIVGLTSGLPESYVYACSMFVGFALFRWLHRGR